MHSLLLSSRLRSRSVAVGHAAHGDRGQRGFFRVLTLGFASSVLALGCATPEQEPSLSWAIAFECADQAKATQSVEVSIAPGPCTRDSSPVYRATFLRGGANAAADPGRLPPGGYSFHATGFGVAGAITAEACREVNLPSAESVELLLTGPEGCEPASVDLQPMVDASVEQSITPMDTNDAGPAGPYLTIDQLDLVQGEVLNVRFTDVTKPGNPFIGIYGSGVVAPVATFMISYKKGESIKSGSHDFPGLAPGEYTVELVYDSGPVDQVPVRIRPDGDGDMIPDADDGCPMDAAKVTPGPCGCGKLETDGDKDTVPDCVDECPSDPGKAKAGQCGCGFLESFGDQDGDGLADCYDACPVDPGKIKPLQCGCGSADTDSDGDLTPNCKDGCIDDPSKVAAGVCGCGVSDKDTDTDGFADCLDACPNDPGKIASGLCGCGTSDVDTDSDKTPDCRDACPSDRYKLAPGVCGCGVIEDQDSDGAPDCQESCPTDPAKTALGLCGCGIADTDVDGDGTLDCFDGCPNDRQKTQPLVCGCGKPDIDTDQDGLLNCQDGCPSDPAKSAVGVCGCGVSDVDSDGDKTSDCKDQCVSDPLKIAAGTCGCGRKEPFDNASFKDAQGYACSGWKGYDCTQAVEKYKYTQAQETAILANCSKTCGICP